MTVVAIDGPAGSGKSTIAAGLAARLGVPHIDTGAYYRAAALAVLRAGADRDDPEGIDAVLRRAAITREGGRTLLDGEDVEDEIRGGAVTAAVSSVSRHALVRQRLVALQQAAVGDGGAVVEGRDAGTVVVPAADVKVWLTASVRERARRRATQVGDAREDSVAAHAADIERRDRSDAAQMVSAADAVEIDTTGLTVDQILDAIVARVRCAVPPQ